MRLRHLRIERFRGIRELDWSLTSDFVCLVGPGDSMKTTILDAVELALCPRVSPPFFDTDFSDGDSTNPIIIDATIGDLPDYLIQERKFGLRLRGWHPIKGIQDEPDDSSETALTIRLYVDSALDPQWTVITNRDPEGKPIGVRDRQELGVAYIGAFLDRHLAWGHGSVLSRSTIAASSLSELLAQASRAARSIFDTSKVPELDKAASEAAKNARHFGIGGQKDYCPRLDAKSVSISTGGLSLHDGAVPLRRAGLGTRRLLALALQHRATPNDGLTLLDEIEYGLEPHRIRRLLGVLRSTDSKPPDEPDPGSSRRHPQVLATTHSPTVIQELPAGCVHVARRTSTAVEIVVVPDVLQPLVRRLPSALLSNRVLVCEGKTEIGVMRALGPSWLSEGQSLAERGIALVNGGGTEAPATAMGLRSLGYDTAYFGDSDRPLEPDAQAMTAAQISVAIWDDDMSIEERLMTDLGWDAVHELIRIAIGEWGDLSVRTSIAAHLDIAPEDLQDSIDVWPSRIDHMALRSALAKSAQSMTPSGSKRQGWFKRVDLGEQLGRVLIECVDDIPNSPLAKTLARLRNWVASGVQR